MVLPLDGITVVEVSSFVAAPLCGVTLVELGADVIRVDPLGGAADHPTHKDGRPGAQATKHAAGPP